MVGRCEATWLPRARTRVGEWVRGTRVIRDRGAGNLLQITPNICSDSSSHQLLYLHARKSLGGCEDLIDTDFIPVFLF